MDHKPAIVVAGYSRPSSLQRLLNSLDAARYQTDDIELVISLDHCDQPVGDEVRAVAESFQWRHGAKRLILHKHNLGLRNHILKCGDLSGEYGSIIVLEDDLSVGPEFYNYTVASLAFVADDDRIGGVSLYDHKTNFICRYPFTPLHDGYDNYYLQIAQSWGQAWTSDQWRRFRRWYESRSESELETIPQTVSIPTSVANWPNSSWLKYFIWYLADSNKYFLYPRIGHSTNHADSGTHIGKTTSIWQVPLAQRCHEFRFSKLEDSLAVYDSFFELKPEHLKAVSPLLSAYEFDVDLYGTKDLTKTIYPYVLTSRNSQEAKLRFALTKKPLVANFREAVTDQTAQFSLAKTEDVFGKSRLTFQSIKNIQYFFGHVPVRTIAKNMFRYYFQSRT